MSCKPFSAEQAEWLQGAFKRALEALLPSIQQAMDAELQPLRDKVERLKGENHFELLRKNENPGEATAHNPVLVEANVGSSRTRRRNLRRKMVKSLPVVSRDSLIQLRPRDTSSTPPGLDFPADLSVQQRLHHLELIVTSQPAPRLPEYSYENFDFQAAWPHSPQDWGAETAWCALHDEFAEKAHTAAINANAPFSVPAVTRAQQCSATRLIQRAWRRFLCHRSAFKESGKLDDLIDCQYFIEKQGMSAIESTDSAEVPGDEYNGSSTPPTTEAPPHTLEDTPDLDSAGTAERTNRALVIEMSIASAIEATLSFKVDSGEPWRAVRGIEDLRMYARDFAAVAKDLQEWELDALGRALVYRDRHTTGGSLAPYQQDQVRMLEC
jgi:hypothetical protein